MNFTSMNSIRLNLNSRFAAPRTWLGIVGLSALLLAGCANAPKDETAAWNADKLYAEAKDELSSGAYDKAAKLFERLEGRAAGTLLGQQAQIDRAYTMYRSGDKAQALSILERFMKLHPTSPAMDYALYLQGLVNFNDNLGILGNLSRQELSERDQQASRDSYQSFKQLVEQQPQSKYVPDARLRMNYIVNALAAYELHVARYYYRRGAYLAAANRAQQAIQEFQQSPSAEEALFLMMKSYDRLGLTQLRDDTDRVLRKSFPNSSYLAANATAGITANKGRAWWQFW
jgi:outer membrane protein assembly factor BamD